MYCTLYLVRTREVEYQDAARMRIVDAASADADADALGSMLERARKQLKEAADLMLARSHARTS